MSADVDEVNSWKERLDRWVIPEHKSTMGKLLMPRHGMAWHFIEFNKIKQ